MDPEYIFYIVLALFWFLSQLSSLAKKKPRPEEAPRRTRPAPLPAAAPELPDRQARGALESLTRLETRLDKGLPDLDEKTRALVTARVERSFPDEARRVRDALERALSQRNAALVFEEIARAHDLAAETEELLESARRLSKARRQPEVVQPLRLADRLVEEIYAPLRSFATASLPDREAPPPPVAVISDPGAEDPLRRSPLAPSILFLPRSVTVDPVHWSLVAHEVARYLVGLAPGIYQDIYDGLYLRVSEAEIATDREALTRLLFGAYLARLFGDAVGACLFGPAYLRALARLYAEPEAPSRVTTIYLNEDGTVHPEPPAHLRIHVTAAWLSEMGFANEAEETVSAWDERHGHPSVFAFFRSMGTLPAAVVLENASDLAVELYQLELSSLGTRTLASLPGVGEGTPRRAAWLDAKASFLRGERAIGSARTLLAAAMDAALEAPGAATAIRNALHETAGPAPKLRKMPAPRDPAAAGPRPSTPLGATNREIIEALLLGEILLERRGSR